MSEDLVNLAQRWPERAATHYDGCEADHVGCLVKKLAREVERLTAERDAAQVEVDRLRTTLAWADATIYRLQAERDQTATIPKGREVGRFGLDGHYLDYEALKPTRPTDEDIWREVFLRCVSEYITGEKRVIVADSMLAEYRKRWPR